MTDNRLAADQFDPTITGGRKARSLPELIAEKLRTAADEGDAKEFATPGMARWFGEHAGRLREWATLLDHAASPPDTGIDVERLARAMRRHREYATTSAGPHIFSPDHCPPFVAEEYAALGSGAGTDAQRNAISRSLAAPSAGPAGTGSIWNEPSGGAR